MRSALVDYFREQGHIMIATEAGAEGINLQFCSLVVNYDLPWNPQRIEQRIGRCHRYGQKHDVVVLNFLNSKNAADQRVFQLLSEKFRLFEGVFGASDDVLGAIESLDQTEDHIVLVATTGKGPVDEEAARRLFSLPGTVGSQRLSFGSPDSDRLTNELTRLTAGCQERIQSRIAGKNAEFFEAEADKLDGWADDLKLGLEREIKELDKQIKEARKGAVAAVSLEAKLAAQKRMKALESERNSRRRTLFEAQDEIDHKRGELIAQIESKLTQKVKAECLFTICWTVV